jgi:hypothetical protein
MRKKIDDGGFETPYRLRKQVVEPVFGQIKQARGFRQFLLRGVEKVRAEWAMICTTHNLLKLFALAKPCLSGRAPRDGYHRMVVIAKVMFGGGGGAKSNSYKSCRRAAVPILA